jgi:hypothetical protein
MGRLGLRDGLLDAGGIGDIDLGKGPPISCLGLPDLGIEIEQRDLRAARRQQFRRRRAKARGAAGDDGCQSADIHAFSPRFDGVKGAGYSASARAITMR